MNRNLNRVLHALATLALIFTAACAAEMGEPDPDPPVGGVMCNDGVCEGSETNASCPADCPGAVCGNTRCETGETQQTCPADCTPAAVCGNTRCEAGETQQTCPADCGSPAVCGNSVCEANETPSSCPADCAASLVTQNNSSYTVYDLYVSPCSSTSWGPDQLGPNVIQSGQYYRLFGIPAGCYHFRAVGPTTNIYWERTQNTYLQNGQTFTWTLTN